MPGQVYSSEAAAKQFQTFLDLLPTSDAIAIHTLEPRRKSLTFEELKRFSESLDMAKFGVSMGSHGNQPDRLCTIIPNCPESAVCFLAMSQYCTYAPLNIELTEAELEFEVDDLPAKALVIMCEEGLQGANARIVQVARKTNVPVIELVPCNVTVGLFSLKWAASSPIELAACQGRIRAQRQDTALVLHTSGTTRNQRLCP
jgi:acyl-coenzyme A synthetase/AMP-(fatty) acid ligase